jgi:Uma2 family endonuclease
MVAVPPVKIPPSFTITDEQFLEVLRAKMQEYLDNGCRLGWLIDSKTQLAEIYRPEQSPEVLQAPLTLSGESVLPGFILDLQAIFSRA